VQFDGKTGFGTAMARAIDWCRDHNNGGTEIDGARRINVCASRASDQPRQSALCGQGKPAIINALSRAGVINISARRFTEAKRIKVA
jgi:hypothetical protein